MDARDIIKEIMVKQDTTNAVLAKRLSVSNATIWDRLNNRKGRKDIPVSLLNEMLKALDYKVTIVPHNKRISEGDYEVE